MSSKTIKVLFKEDGAVTDWLAFFFGLFVHFAIIPFEEQYIILIIID